MKILLAADGSRFTKKALAFLLVNDLLRGPEASLVVLNVQAPLSSNVMRHLGKEVADDYYRAEAQKVLKPILRFLAQHGLACAEEWCVGHAGEEIVNAARRHKVQMIAMGTHGHGLVGRIVLGSVAQRVVSESPIPVLLVK